MGKLIYGMNTSLDGYIADERGDFDWSAPDAEVHAYINALTASAGTHLYGRRMYEVMLAWESIELEGEPAEIRDFAAQWREADKVVYSRTLSEVSSARTHLEREFDADGIRALKDNVESDILIAGPDLARHAFLANLVDKCHLFVSPVVVGGGKPAFSQGLRVDLDLVQQRTFDSGVIHLGYRVR
ncbi:MULTISPECIES: dihydrofolate reductase family protein [unclassified Diaminobutyricimonas]|uniref:dihydrofolate reductase family protein n=1 Tax=unclassified Diaminobutyricimonas TaxID=2643261 RepID=UPI0012F50EDE|nr:MULTISPECIES: dihydrofolate reductase family protein [unclassified Diaminobutyricimonas]